MHHSKKLKSSELSQNEKVGGDENFFTKSAWYRSENLYDNCDAAEVDSLSRSDTVGQSAFGYNVCQKGMSYIVQSAGRALSMSEKVTRMKVVQARSNRRRTAAHRPRERVL